MEIVEYRDKYKQAFIDLNTAWIEKYFQLEQADIDTLYHAETYLKKGGMIFFAVEGDEVLSTCMTFPLDSHVWELSKLATNEKFQGKGAGSAVFQACMDYAIGHGAEKLTLETNHILKAALHIYEKCGLKPIPLDSDSKYSRADVRLAYDVIQMARN